MHGIANTLSPPAPLYNRELMTVFLGLWARGHGSAAYAGGGGAASSGLVRASVVEGRPRMVANRTLSFEPNAGEAALVIGNFDGVHRGHRALVGKVLALASERGLRPLVMTFDPHPAVALGGTLPPVLTILERKVELLCAMAPNLQVIVQRFDREFAQLSPLEFVERILVGGFQVRELVVGHNFRFGRDREGNFEELQRFGQTFGFSAHAFALEADTAGVISSSRIRRLIIEGELGAANALLGRPHALIGTVVAGDGRGRTLGFPTANLEAVAEVRPQQGVYACRVEAIEGSGTTDVGGAVVHLGPRPTVERGDSIEVHVIDRNLDLYGKQLRVSVLQKLRGLQRFSDLDGLKRQIGLDIAAARQLFGGATA